MWEEKVRDALKHANVAQDVRVKIQVKVSTWTLSFASRQLLVHTMKHLPTLSSVPGCRVRTSSALTFAKATLQ